MNLPDAVSSISDDAKQLLLTRYSSTLIFICVNSIGDYYTSYSICDKYLLKYKMISGKLDEDYLRYYDLQI